mmetsp:Transcript_51152/g.92293  ORF Transcript_51152/g.92293 Transcript_51152/m.92293 type:complete len:136 (-) Transcript_51152:13-420(-)
MADLRVPPQQSLRTFEECADVSSSLHARANSLTLSGTVHLWLLRLPQGGLAHHRHLLLASVAVDQVYLWPGLLLLRTREVEMFWAILLHYQHSTGVMERLLQRRLYLELQGKASVQLSGIEHGSSNLVDASDKTH